MLLLTALSSAAFFVEVTFYEWADNETHYELVYPDPAYFAKDARKIFPQLKFGDDDDIIKKLTNHFDTMSERFSPTDNYYLALPHLETTPEEAQAKLFKVKNPSRIVLVGGAPVITAPGEVWQMSDTISRAYIILGYIPPTILHDPLEWQMIADVKRRNQLILRSHVNALIAEYKTVTELV